MKQVALPKDLAVRRGLGFTLVEALLSIVIVGFMASVMSGLYISGLQTLDAGNERMLFDSQLRSRMEQLISTKFELIEGDSEDVTVNGQTFKIKWKVGKFDLDGDSEKEDDAKEIWVYLNHDKDHGLKMIVVDHAGKVGKI